MTLTYEYRRSQVWLDHLSAERDPHAYDLCRRHADDLSVPLGWHLADRRRRCAPSAATSSPADRPDGRLRQRPTTGCESSVRRRRPALA